MQAVRSRFTDSDKTTGVLLVIGSCISLQIGAAFAVQLFPQLGAWGVTTLRLGVAALVICALTRPRFWAWDLPQWIAVALLGASFAFMNGAFYHAIELLPLGLAVSVEFIGPLVLAAVLSRRLIDGLWIGLATIGMALIGVEKAFGAEHISTLGLAFALVAGFFWACYILASSRVGRLIDGAGGPAPPAQQCLLYSAQPGTRHRGYRRLAVTLPRHRGSALDGNSTADGSLHGHHHHLTPSAGSGRTRSRHQHYRSGRRTLAQLPQELHQLVSAQGGRWVRPGADQVGRCVLGEGHVGAHQNKVARMAATQHGGISQTPDVLKDL